jgi:UDP-galactopyranose mutase
MNTFRQMGGVDTVEEAKAIIDEQRKGIGEIRNLEDQCISMVGSDVYHKLVQGYTEKQWGRDCRELPAFIIRRLPVRFEFNSDYFSDPYQGIPIGGYTKIIEKMLENIEVRLDYDFLKQRREIDYKKLVYSGPIDAFFDYRLGPLEYRSVRFENEILNRKHFQHNSVVNYTSKDVPYTRIIEHKYFEFGEQEKTVISREYSEEWRPGKEAYYPINDDKNMTLYRKYRELAADLPDVIIGGRLGDYRYYDMDEVVYNALEAWRTRSNS